MGKAVEKVVGKQLARFVGELPEEDAGKLLARVVGKVLSLVQGEEEITFQPDGSPRRGLAFAPSF